MTLPQTSVSVVDGGLGVVAANGVNVHVKLGVCSGATANTLISISEPTNATTLLGYGPLARAVAFSLGSITAGNVGRPVLAMRVAASTAGSCGDTVKTAVGSSTGTVAASGAAYDTYELRVKISRTGTLGTAAFQYSLDGGDTYSEETSVPGGGTYAIPNSGITLTFTPGGGATYFEALDVHAIQTRAPAMTTSDIATAITALLADSSSWEGLHLVGTVPPLASAVTEAGTSPPDVTLSGTPVKYIDLKVEITTGGNRGTAVFRYSTNGGQSWDAESITTAATYVMPGTGLTLNFATGTAYATDNVYTADTLNYSALATLYGAMKTHMDTCETQGRYGWCVIEAPTVAQTRVDAATGATIPNPTAGSAMDTELIAALSAATKSARMCIAAGFADVTSPLDSKIETRSAAWPLVARVVALPISQSPGERDDLAMGPLARVEGIYRDERGTEALYAAKIATLQTDDGFGGFYVTGSGVFFSPAGSDITHFPYRRVLDAGCRATKAAARRYQSKRIKVNTTTGFILETEARRIENDVSARVLQALGDNASGLTVRVKRDDNLLSTSTLRFDVRVIPLAIVDSVTVSIGLLNPALAV